jgi:hypothetical protein
MSDPAWACLTTITGLGGVGPGDQFLLTIDEAQGTYTLTAAGHTANTVLKTCTNPPTPEPYPWGPVFGPGGAGVPLVDASYPLPSKGVHLKMTVPTFEDKPNPLAIPWNVSWDFSPICKVDT